MLPRRSGVSADAGPPAATQFQRRPARFLAWVLAALHAVALLAALASLEGWPLAFVAVALVLSAVQALAATWLLPRDSAMRFELHGDGEICWYTRAGKRQSGRIGGDTLVWPGLVILAICPEGRARPRWFLLDPTSTDPASWRALRVILRWGGTGAGRENRATRVN